MPTKKPKTQKPRTAPKKKAASARGSTKAKKPAAPKAAGKMTRGKTAKPSRAPRKPPEPGALKENPQAHALAKRMAQAVLDKKALDVVILDVRGRSSYADYLVLASGESERQVAAMADGVEDKLREEGLRPLGSEGHSTGQWVLLDYGEVVGHFFHTEMRAFYDLEGLWADAGRESVR
jgi:ribosome-associated protein